MQTAAILMQFIVVSECKYYNFRTNGCGGDDDDDGDDDDGNNNNNCSEC